MAAPNVKKPKANSPSRKRGMKLRSGLEATVEAVLATSTLKYNYEDTTLTYLQPQVSRRYLPDFRLNLTGITEVFLEVKGILTSADRKKLRLIREQHPSLLVILIFGNAKNKLNKKSPTQYWQWCDRYDILWVDVKDFIKKGIPCLLALIQKQQNGKSHNQQKKKSTQSLKLERMKSLKTFPSMLLTKNTKNN